MADDLNKLTTAGRHQVKDIANGPPGLNTRSLYYLDVYAHATELQNFVQLLSVSPDTGLYARRIARGRPGPWFDARPSAALQAEIQPIEGAEK